MYSNNFKMKKKVKPFIERSGDWFCFNCKNLNFAFRVVCNRCHISKAESLRINEKDELNKKKNEE
jgi:hypothetical protein